MTIIASPRPIAAGTVQQTPSDVSVLATRSPLPFEAPPFDRMHDDDFGPAIRAGMRAQLAEIAAIADDLAAPTFDNTIVALERSGADLIRARRIFGNLTASNTNDTLQATRTALAPESAAHDDAISLDPKLFARIQTVHEQRARLAPDAVGQRLTERYYARFVRAGALLDDVGKQRLKRLNTEESTLRNAFTGNLLEEASAIAIVVDARADLDGMTDDDIAAAGEAAKARGLAGKWLLALRNTTTQPLLASLRSRVLRERIYRASTTRNASGVNDNRPLITRLAQLRAEKAGLLGHADWASYVIDDQMAGTSEAAKRLMREMVPAAVANARREAARMQALVDAQPGGFTLEAWDWDFHAEQVRRADYALDKASIRPYLELDTVVRDGLFYAAHAMYGLGFEERRDLPVYRCDVRVFEIRDARGDPFALLYLDFYAHDGKKGGAWMSTFVDQSTLLGQQPVVVNNLNVAKPAPGLPTLLDFDQVITLFHELGHGLHGLLSRQEYPSFSGTGVTRDFVEFPSQLNENWALEPRVFANYARHWQTGEAMPRELAERIVRSRRFNQGYATVEYLAAALLDLEWHSLPADAPRVTDVDAFEQAALQKYGLDLAQVPPRYRSCYFSHIWDGNYSANYYAYLWAEVLAVDGYEWFVEHGGMTRDNGLHLCRTVLSQGGSKDAAALYRDFRGRDPVVEPLLVRRGLR